MRKKQQFLLSSSARIDDILDIRNFQHEAAQITHFYTNVPYHSLPQSRDPFHTIIFLSIYIQQNTQNVIYTTQLLIALKKSNCALNSQSLELFRSSVISLSICQSNICLSAFFFHLTFIATFKNVKPALQ